MNFKAKLGFILMIEQTFQQLTSCNDGADSDFVSLSCDTECQTVTTYNLDGTNQTLYSCFNMSLPSPSGTLIDLSGNVIVVNFCSTDDCNTENAIEKNINLWCNYLDETGDFYNQSCSNGQCVVGINPNTQTQISACIKNNDGTSKDCPLVDETIYLVMLGFETNVTITSCCNDTNNCNQVLPVILTTSFIPDQSTQIQPSLICNVGIDGNTSSSICSTVCGIQAITLFNVTNIHYFCYDPSTIYFPAGTIIDNNGTKTVTNYCSTESCNTGLPVDTATLWCNFGENKSTYFNQSCKGQCGTGMVNNLSISACIPDRNTCAIDQVVFVPEVNTSLTIKSCCQINNCNNLVRTSNSGVNSMSSRSAMTVIILIIVMREFY